MSQERGYSSIDHILDAYHPVCAAVARRLCRYVPGGCVAASDVVQDAMLAAVSRARQGKAPLGNPTHLRRWFRMITIRTFLNARRRKTPIQAGSELLKGLVDSGTSPSEKVGNIETRGVVRDTFARLSDHDQQLIQWRWEDGLSCREIGLRLGVSAEYASRITRNALVRMRSGLPVSGQEAPE